MIDQNQIQIILFDLGGVLVEIGGLRQMIKWTGRDMDPAELWKQWLLSKTVREFESGKISSQVFAGRLIKEFNLSVDAPTFLMAFKDWPRGLFPGVPVLLEKLAPKFTLAALPNTNEVHWPIVREMGLLKYFTHIFPSYLTGYIKPDPETFVFASRSMQERPDHILFLDDNQVNIDGAESVGLHTLKVTCFSDLERFFNTWA
jgi:putative hydrolase of the HAD superfamily